MNYRHAFHAGNFADVLKHAALARILVHLAEKSQPFRVLDTHAGSGLYDLAASEASRTGEWREGIARLMAAELAPDVRALLAPYLDPIVALNSGAARNTRLKRYPGSPLVALNVMRAHDRLIACELEPKAARALTNHLRSDKRAKAIAIDGWQALKAYLPPVERRGLVVIDPPYEDPDEFTKLPSRLADALRKWATGVYLVWYPIKGTASVAFVKRLRELGMAKLLRAELHLAPLMPDQLTGSGLIVINPPWRLADELRAILPALAGVFAGPSGRFLVELSPDKM